jgi:adenine-specific DNA-methyltransferase
MESFFRREEDRDPREPVHFERSRPLAEGEMRDRDSDLDPQIIWNGARIRLSKDERDQLAETGEVEIGDAQLVWRGKDTQDWSDLIVQVPPLYIQEKIHPKAIIDDLKRRSDDSREAQSEAPDLFADFNGIDPEAKAEFYQHDQHWSNRMILGDSLQVMASLAERESLRGKVQCIYFDPPYGIKFGSNWQVSTQSRDVKDGKLQDISREPEQVKAFRDTWKDGINSYLTYLRDRLTVMRDLLTESGSIFVQIGEENVHRIRAILDEVFGDENFVSLIFFLKTSGKGSATLDSSGDYICWYARSKPALKVRKLLAYRKQSTVDDAYGKIELEDGTIRGVTSAEKRGAAPLPTGKRFMPSSLYSDSGGQTTRGQRLFEGRAFQPLPGYFWRTNEDGLIRLAQANRLVITGQYLRYKMYADDYGVSAITNYWDDVRAGGFGESKIYVVQTNDEVVSRCILLATDPGDLVLDPTCGSGTTAFVAEQWGRRWITIDTSRVALALARTRVMAARYPWYLLADSRVGAAKESELTGRASEERSFGNDIRQGFVYERVPHITLKSIANNAEIDVISEKWQTTLDRLRASINTALSKNWQEWEIPRGTDDSWPDTVKADHVAWWEARISRQKEIDHSIARAADVELLYDRPYADNNRVRVAGPFTVESLSPHRVLPASDAELIEEIEAAEGRRIRDETPENDFAQIVIEHLKTAGVHQHEKGDRITFDSVQPWPGNWIGAEASFTEGESGVERRAAIFIGPEFGTVGRSDLVAAAREAADARFDVVIACAFNFDAHSSEFDGLGSLKIIKARINPDMHMAGDLKNTGKGNMFVVFGEPDIDVLDDSGESIRVKVNGVDVFDPNTGDIRSNDTRGIAAWFVDTDYNEESFFVRHAYFLGANDPYKNLKTALRAEIDEEAWSTLYSDTSRPFARPETGRIAVKVINHFGDEVMKVFSV